MKLKYEMLSETGLKRTVNQDRITAYSNDKISLFVVADGMGGHSDGEYASERVINGFNELWNDISDLSEDFQAVTDKIVAMLKKINAELMMYSGNKNIICGSTVSVLLLYNEFFAVINVGDSPVYFADSKNMVHASTEHSYGVIKQKSTVINPEDIDNKRADRLTQAIGAKDEIFPSIRTGIITKRTVFLLCSDGISRYFDDKAIGAILKSTVRKRRTIAEALDTLKSGAYQSGASDNLSEILVELDVEKKENPLSKFCLAIFAAVIVFIIWAAVNLFIIL